MYGSYSWLGPDGIQYGYEYIADENGYRTMELLPPPAAGLSQNAVLSLVG